MPSRSETRAPGEGDAAAASPAGDAELDRKLVRGSAWLAVSYGGGQAVSLVATAVLAHLIEPSAFGLIALASIVTVALGMLQESGLSLAVIHRRQDVEGAAASAFAFMIVLAVVLYGVAVGLAPVAAWAFHQPRLETIMPVLMLMLPLRALGNVPSALIEREIAFGARARGELAAAAAQACTSIPLALLGFGVWSLVFGQLANAAVQTTIYWVVAPSRPSLRLARLSTLRELGRFGRYVTAGNLVMLVDGNADTVVAGRLVGVTGLGYYSLAWRLSNLPATGLAYIVGRVMFPAYSTLQHDLEAFREAFLTNLRRVALVSLPTGLVILIAARPIVVGIFGSEWSPAVTPLRILAVFGLIRSFAGTTGAVFQASGRPQLVLQISLGHLAILVAALAALAPPFGIDGVAAAMTLSGFCSLLASYWFARRILQLPFRRLGAELARPCAASLPVLGALLVLLGVVRVLSAPQQLVVLLLAAGAAYVAGVALLDRREVQTIAAAFRS